MTCLHSNAPGYLFCSTCGAKLARTRCRCGFITQESDLFCGGCGLAMWDESKNPSVSVNPHSLYDLAELGLSLKGVDARVNTTTTNVTQDDIEGLIQQNRGDNA